MIPPFVDPPPALVCGYAARALAVLLREVDLDRLPPIGREQVAATVRAIEMAGEAWLRSRQGSDLGTSEPVVAEVGARLAHEMSIDDAAGVLGVSARRVRTLAAEGLGRKVGYVWVLDGAAVLALAERRAVA